MDKVKNTHQAQNHLSKTKQLSHKIFDLKPLQQLSQPIPSKMASYMTSSTPTTTKFNSTLLTKDGFNSSNDTSPGPIGRIKVQHIYEFFGILLKRFRSELNFHISHADKIRSLQQQPNKPNPELSLIKSLLEFDSFLLLNKKENISFYKVESIIDRLQTLVSVLEEAIKKFSKENLSKILCFFEENECIKCFEKIFPDWLFESDCFRKVCSELWRLLRFNGFMDINETNIQSSFDNLKLFIYGISFPSPCAEDYPLHKAVYSSNLAMIRRICAREKSPVFYSHIEQADPAGVTPLMLAVLLGNKDAALILVNHGANPKHRSYPYARTPLEEAIHSKNRGMIKILLLASTNIKQTIWEDNKNTLIEFLKRVPDFSFEMSWECDSKIIPFIKKITPSDTYKVYKRGSSIRIDLSLLGWSKLKSVRGNSSIIFNGHGSEEGKLLMIDHIKKTSVDMLAEINSLALENKIDELIKQEKMNSEIKTENVVFKPATTWKGEGIEANINGYNCTKYIAKGTFSLLFTRRNVLMDINAKQFNTFEQYFSDIVKQPLWILEDSQGQINWNENHSAKIENYNQRYQDVVKSLFEKQKKSNESSIRDGPKGRKGIEKVTLTQKELLKDYTKDIVASIYMCDNLPLTLEHFFPILEILSNVSPHINRLKGFLEKTISINKASFPLKACIPIFFTLNAILSIREFKFTAPDDRLFDVDCILQRTSTLNKGLDFVYRDERFRTEGGSNEEDIQQRWQELIKHDSDEEKKQHIPLELIYQEEESDEVEQDEVKEDKDQIIKSFFKQTRDSLKNDDFVNVYDSENGEDILEDEDLDDHDISEKCWNDTLKLSSHRTHLPKTLMIVEQKVQLDTSNEIYKIISNNISFQKSSKGVGNLNLRLISQNRVEQNIHSLRIRENYKFLGNLNQRRFEKEDTGRSSKKESARNINEMDLHEANLRELHMKKINKYTLKKQNLMTRVNHSKIKLQEEKEGSTQRSQHSKGIESQAGIKFIKKAKHERIKSLEYPNILNFEAFYDKLWLYEKQES